MTATPPAGTPPSSGFAAPKDVFAILGLQDLPENEKKVLLEKLERVIQERAIHMIVSQLNDDQCKDLNDQMDKGLDQTQVIDYLRSTIPDLDDRIRKLVEEFRDELLLEVDDIRNELSAGKTPSTLPIKHRQQLQLQLEELKKHMAEIERQMHQAMQTQNQAAFATLQEARQKTHEQMVTIERQLAV